MIPFTINNRMKLYNYQFIYKVFSLGFTSSQSILISEREHKYEIEK